MTSFPTSRFFRGSFTPLLGFCFQAVKARNYPTVEVEEDACSAFIMLLAQIKNKQKSTHAGSIINPPPPATTRRTHSTNGQARDIDESRFMYDQLAVLSPVMLALTAATPVFKGRLVDTDVRWNTIALSVDDRTLAERGLLDHAPVSNGRSLLSWFHSFMCQIQPECGE